MKDVNHEHSKLLNNQIKINYMSSTNRLNKLVKAQIYDYCHYSYAAIFYVTANIFQASIAPITDVLQKELQITSSQFGMLASSYYLTYLILQVPFGMMLQRYSHHIILLIISCFLTICFTLFGFVNTLTFGVLLRALCGIFAAPTWIITISLVGKHFGNNKVSSFSGCLAMSACLMALIILPIQGYIYQQYHMWRITYFIFGFIAFVTVIALICTLYCERHSIIKNRTDTDASWMHLFNDESSDNENENEIATLKSSVCGNKLMLVMSNYLNWCLGFQGFAMFTMISSIFGLWLVPYLMLKFNYSRTLASLFSAVGVGSTGIGQFVFGVLSSKYKNRKIYIMLNNFLASFLLYLLYLDSEILNEYVVFVLILLSGFGAGTNILFTLAMEYNSKDECQETATGFVNMIHLSAAFISQYFIGILIEYHWQYRNNTGLNNNQIHENQIREYNVDDYQFAFSCVIPTCLIIGIATTILLKETNGKNI
eukprot:552812_1